MDCFGVFGHGELNINILIVLSLGISFLNHFISHYMQRRRAYNIMHQIQRLAMDPEQAKQAIRLVNRAGMPLGK